MKENLENTKESKIKNKSGIIKIIIAMIVTAIITYFLTVNITFKSYLNTSNMTYLSAKINLIKQKLNSESIYDLDESKMLESALKGYVSGLDINIHSICQKKIWTNY